MNKIIILYILLFCTTKAYAVSPWIRNKNELFTILEGSINASQTKYFLSSLDIDKANNYKAYDLKLYFEYGLFNSLTLDGYIKSNKTELIKDQQVHWNVRNNYYYNLGLTHQLYSVNSFVLVHSLSWYSTIDKNEKYSSINYLDSKDSVAYYISFGLNNSNPVDKIFSINNGYFISGKFGYRKSFDSFFDTLESEFSLGLKTSTTSMLIFQYISRFDFYEGTSFEKVGKKGNGKDKQEDIAIQPADNYLLAGSSNKLKVSSVIAFKDNLSVEFSYTRILGNSDTVRGSTIAFAIWRSF